MSKQDDNRQPEGMYTGRIIKGIGGFYYVHVPGRGTYECRAKGLFRKDGQKPLVGDEVLMQCLDERLLKGNVEEILPRHSELIRPAVANVDQALIAFAITKPEPNLNLLDRFLIMIKKQDLDVIICFNKMDIADENQIKMLEESYQKCSKHVLFLSAINHGGTEELRDLLRNKVTALAGPSGVGKSTLINALCQKEVMETGQISTKIERGKHTTRHSELFLIAQEEKTYIMDTPGFSSLMLPPMDKGELSAYYPEFTPYECECKFAGCSHIYEPVCGIKNALKEKLISELRYDNYCKLYHELKDREEKYTR